ncbi:hypothetical protein BH23GEM6_BH23GEM6_24270 [soil metagenome]
MIVEPQAAATPGHEGLQGLVVAVSRAVEEPRAADRGRWAKLCYRRALRDGKILDWPPSSRYVTQANRGGSALLIQNFSSLSCWKVARVIFSARKTSSSAPLS